MATKTRTIEVDERTAAALTARAAERGMSVSQLLTEFAIESGPVAVDTEEIAELDRRWAAVEAGQATTSHDNVVRWVQTWGTPAFRQWRDR
jgi:predicted transcriptional regulator